MPLITFQLRNVCVYTETGYKDVKDKTKKRQFCLPFCIVRFSFFSMLSVSHIEDECKESTEKSVEAHEGKTMG
jgi:hypothetical protein